MHHLQEMCLGIPFIPCYAIRNTFQAVLSARTEETLQAVAEDIRSARGEAIVVVGDVSKVQALGEVAVGYS